MNFYDAAAVNRRRSVLLIVLFLGLLAVLGYLIGVLYAFIGYYAGDRFILSASRAIPVTKRDDPYLINTVEGLAIAAGIPMPKVYLIQEDSPNAFATGRDPQHATIAVTSGLRKRMNRQELDGVHAHGLNPHKH